MRNGIRTQRASGLPATRALTLTVCLALSWLGLSWPALTHAADACTSASIESGWHTFTVRTGGRERQVPVYVPASGAGRSRLPLVFDLHGSGGSGLQQAAHSGLPAEADRHAFLVASPDGGISDPAHPTAHYWNLPGVPLTGNLATPGDAFDDVQFFRDAIQQIGKAACIDSHRVYVTGFSGGARMASLLACELSDQFAAIAPVAGLRAGIAQAGDFTTPDAKTCTPSRPVPIIAFHGVHDPQNRFDGDREKRWGYSVPVALAQWAKLDGCQPTAAEQKVSAHVTKVSYSGCRSAAQLVLYRTDAPIDHGGGHIWPHPTPTGPSAAANVEDVDELDATALIWEFFAQHQS